MQKNVCENLVKWCLRKCLFFLKKSAVLEKIVFVIRNYMTSNIFQ